MKMTILLAMLILFGVYVEVSESKLLGVVEVIRHGSRAPHDFMNTGKKLFFDSTSMVLTVNGFRQHYLLGQWLRDRYIKTQKFLSIPAKKKELWLYSSSTQRTIFSLTAHMLGLYHDINVIPHTYNDKMLKFNQNPPIPGFGKKYNGKSIRIHIKKSTEPLLHAWKCKNSKGKELKRTLLIKNIFNFNEKLLDKMLEVFKKKLPFIFKNGDVNKYSKYFLVKRIIGYVRCAKFLVDDKLFKFSEDFKNLIRRFVINKWFNTRLVKENNDKIKIAVSTMFDYISNYFQNRISKKTTKKLIIFSGHDTNLVDIISNILDHNYIHQLINNFAKSNDIKSYNFLIPQFASNILFELHEEDNDHFVKILYNAVEIKENFIESKVKYVKDKGIPIKDFINLLSSRINPKYKKLNC